MKTNSRPQKVKIGFALWSLEYLSGSEKVVYDIVCNLDRSLYKIFIITISDGFVRSLYEKVGARVMVFPKRGRLDMSFMRDMRRAIIAEGIQVLNPHHFMPLFWSFWATLGTSCRLVYTEHSRWQLERLEPINKIFNWIFLKRADIVIAISKQIEEYYLKRLRLDPAKIRSITNGIDLIRYRGPADPSLRREIGLTEGNPVIGIVASIKPLKNHPTLLRGFAEVVRTFPGATLLIIGKDFSSGTIHRLAQAMGLQERVRFLGQRDDVPQLLRLMDVFCLTSRYEGMPLAILEAMASGLPVIGADVLGINEVIEHGSNGLLYPVEDSEALAASIIELLTDRDRRLKLGAAGRAYVTRHYDQAEKNAAYHSLFQELAGTSS